MENSEEYLLRVLRRTQLGLQDSLMPLHASKLVKLVEKFENTSTIGNEIQLLKRVSGFQKCAISMEWLYKRVQNPIEDFSPEQFESDVLMLNEKIFEAFLNQPFDLPEPAEVDTPSSFDNSSFFSTENFDFAQGNTVSGTTDTAFSESLNSPLSEPQWDSFGTENQSLGNTASAFESETPFDLSPSIQDSFDPTLFENLERIGDLLSDFGLKMTNERPIAMAVLRMTAKTAVENARTANNIFAQEFFQNLVNVINFIDQEGKIKSEDVASLMLDIGDRVKNAIASPVAGITLLKKTTEFISNPKELLKKK